MFRLLPICACLVLCLFSCGKDDVAPSDENHLTTFIDGVEFSADAEFAAAFEDEEDNELVILGSEDLNLPNARSVFFRLNGLGEVGTYELGLDLDGHGFYEIESIDGWYTFEPGGTGTLEITSITEERVKGTFFFTGLNEDGNSLSFTNGSFDVDIREE